MSAFGHAFLHCKCLLLTQSGPKAAEFQVSRESVSVTDMKNGINILGTLQFQLVMHMSGVQRPAQRRLLDHIMC